LGGIVEYLDKRESCCATKDAVDVAQGETERDEHHEPKDPIDTHGSHDRIWQRFRGIFDLFRLKFVSVKGCINRVFIFNPIL